MRTYENKADSLIGSHWLQYQKQRRRCTRELHRQRDVHHRLAALRSWRSFRDGGSPLAFVQRSNFDGSVLLCNNETFRAGYCIVHNSRRDRYFRTFQNLKYIHVSWQLGGKRCWTLKCRAQVWGRASVENCGGTEFRSKIIKFQRRNGTRTAGYAGTTYWVRNYVNPSIPKR